MKDLLNKFENKQPEIVFDWNDSETDAKAWVDIVRGSDFSVCCVL